MTNSTARIVPKRFFIPFFIGSLIPFLYNQIFINNEEKEQPFVRTGIPSNIATTNSAADDDAATNAAATATTAFNLADRTTTAMEEPMDNTDTYNGNDNNKAAATRGDHGHGYGYGYDHGQDHGQDHGHSSRRRRTYSCAKWINQSSRRRVLLINFLTHDNNNSKQSKNGSAWVSSSSSTSAWRNNAFTTTTTTTSIGLNLQKLLIANDFDVVDYNHYVQSDGDSDGDILKRMTLDDISSFHRIFFMMHSNSNLNSTIDDNDDRKSLVFLQHLFTQRDALCKLRVVITDPTIWNENDNNHSSLQEKEQQLKLKLKLLSKLDKKQILLDFPNERGTFFGGSLVFDDNMKRGKRRGNENSYSNTTSGANPQDNNVKVGVLDVGRTRLNWFNSNDSIINQYYTNTVESLIANNFTIHVLCDKAILKMNDSNHICNNRSVLEGIIVHHQVTEEDFNDIVSQAVFLMGEYDVSQLSTFWIGLAHGAAIININTNNKTHSQEDEYTISPFQLGMPYVYNVEVGDIEGTRQAAESAAIARFESYIPSHFRAGTMNDRVCALLEDNSLCSCPNPLFDVINSQATKEQNEEEQNRDDHTVDCRSSFFVKKSPIFPSLS